MVGGAVRDALLGLPVNDRDWVVVGATPEAMVGAGYLPVGRDFPVFLHPQTREEYALARTERKTARGYHGFAFHARPDVTLEQDLARRDLTINAMAQDEEGNVVDPYGGRRDLQDKVLRHVTTSFREDPVRILRVARFAARHPDFTVAQETGALMQAMVAEGEVDALVAERVWQELARGLMETKPSRMLDVLHACGALSRLLPELPGAALDRARRLVDTGATRGAPIPVRFALLALGFGGAIREVCERLRVPVDCRDVAEIVAREHGFIHASAAYPPAELLHLLERCDALRKPDRFAQIVQACECEAGTDRPGAAWPQGARLLQALAAARSVATAPIAAAAQREGLSGPAIGERVQAARVAAVAQATSASAA
jgi:tRNA nucleotidyltransferase (CCA-adding enzyme)